MHYAEFAEDESAALLSAIKDYENNKWKTIGQKVGKPAKVSSYSVLDLGMHFLLTNVHNRPANNTLKSISQNCLLSQRHVRNHQVHGVKFRSECPTSLWHWYHPLMLRSAHSYQVL